MRKIGFVGYESEDIILYLAACLRKAGKRVAVEDKTEAGILLRMLEKASASGEETKWYCGICVANSLSGKEEYDYVFLLFGYRVQHPKLYECEYLIFVTDGMPAHAEVLHEVGQWERKQAMLIRNYTEAKHGSKYLELLVGQKQERTAHPADAPHCAALQSSDQALLRFDPLGTREYSPGLRIRRLFFGTFGHGAVPSDRAKAARGRKSKPVLCL